MDFEYVFLIIHGLVQNLKRFSVQPITICILSWSVVQDWIPKKLHTRKPSVIQLYFLWKNFDYGSIMISWKIKPW